jgi:hemerythrin-like domain-containing protein
MNIEKFKQDHSYISEVIRRVEGALAGAGTEKGLEALIAAVRDLFGRLTVHLALEDQVLYPKLKSSSEPTVRDMAKRFEQQMGGIKSSFDEYGKRWPGKLAVGKDPTAFVAETRQTITALKERIRREDSELYPAAERV